MAEESGKRLDVIMDKLFHFPKSKLSSSSKEYQKLRGTKRSNPVSGSSGVDMRLRGRDGGGLENSLVVAKPVEHVPLCRPWDRGDLMRRLSTFKSMTWFGKPKVVSALNCARRGWVNVDIDIIECKDCRARLLFSIPSSWNQHQGMPCLHSPCTSMNLVSIPVLSKFEYLRSPPVDNAALVFSLKLDNGHKLRCPWIDNVCNEQLAQFPPISAEDLVESYRGRFDGLSQLLSLPIISSSSIDNMKSPELKHFIRNFSTPNFRNGSSNTDLIENLEGEQLPNNTKLYYQALKLISLCGWQPHSLPYVVDSKKNLNHSARYGKYSDLPDALLEGGDWEAGLNNGVVNEAIEATSGELQSDPNSVVLDCKQCGATVGLWTFFKVARPVELLRLVGCSQVNGAMDAGSAGPSSAKDGLPNFNLSIAGGPTPEKQSFRATICLPIVGQNLRFRLSSDAIKGDALDQGISQSEYWDKNPVQEGREHAVLAEHVRPELDQQQKINDSGHVPNNAKSLLSDGVAEIVASAQIVDDISLNRNSCDSHAKDNSVDLRREISSTVQTITEPECNGSTGNRAKEIDTSVCYGVGFSLETDVKQLCSGKEAEFDPFSQHRHFCSWITSTGSAAPGWRKTLSSLLRLEGSSHPLSTASPSSSPIIEVDDPIASVRKLFSSPTPKRTKYTHETLSASNDCSTE